MFEVLQDLAPARLSNIFMDTCSNNNYHLRNVDNNLAIPLPKTEFLKKSLSYNGAKIWNFFPNEVPSSETLASFDELISTNTPTVK